MVRGGGDPWVRSNEGGMQGTPTAPDPRDPFSHLVGRVAAPGKGDHSRRSVAKVGGSRVFISAAKKSPKRFT